MAEATAQTMAETQIDVDAMSADQQFHLIVRNRSKKTLVYKDIDIKYGTFGTPGAQKPLETIPSGFAGVVMVITGASGTATGTEGTVYYTVDGTPYTIWAYWDVPYWHSTNTCRPGHDDRSAQHIFWSLDPTSGKGPVLSTTGDFLYQE